MRANVVGALTLLDVCETRGIAHIVFSTGCVYTYDKAGEGPHTLGSGVGFTERDTPNFSGSYYSFTKLRHTGVMFSCADCSLAGHFANERVCAVRLWSDWCARVGAGPTRTAH